MANIAKRSNGQWRARYRDADDKEHARHFDRRIDAQNGSTRSRLQCRQASMLTPIEAR